MSRSGRTFKCPGCGIKTWSAAEKAFHACPQFDGEKAEMTPGRVTTRKEKDGKVRSEMLEMIAAGNPDPAPTGVLVKCGCPVQFWVAPKRADWQCYRCRQQRRAA